MQVIGQAWRTLVGMPVVSIVIVLSLAAGIGVNTVVFSWIQARMVTPLPGVQDGARILGIEAKNDAGMYTGSSWREYLDLRDSLPAFDAIIAFRMLPLYVGDAGQVERSYGLLVSGNYFQALGLRPAAGRFLIAEEFARRAPVAVISHDVWQTRFAGRGDLIGQRLRVNGNDLEIIGVAPPAFQGTVLGLYFDIWVPAESAPLMARGTQELEDRAIRGYSLQGRLAPGVSRAQAQAEARAAMSRLAAAYPNTNAAVAADVLSVWDSPRGPNRLLNAAVIVLQIVMLLLLLTVCANTANLVLARASARQREVGVRLALGSGPWRIVRLIAAENMLLGLVAALGGVAIAVWGTSALPVMPLAGMPIRFVTTIDAITLTFAIALGMLSGILVSAAPAAHLARMDPLAALRAGAMTAGRSRARNVLMGAQVALAIVVLTAGGLFLRGFLATRVEDTGFRRDGVLLAAYDFAGRNLDAAASRAFADRLLERLRAVPAVRQAAIATSVPLDIHGLPLRAFTLEGRVRAEPGQDEALTNTVTPGYFGAMEIPVRDGRDFAPLADVAAAPQVIVNETFVRRFLGDASAIGRRLQMRGRSYVIAGVAADSLYNAFGEPPTPIIYFSYRDRPQSSGEVHLRTRPGAEAALTSTLRAIVRDLDAELPIFNVRTLEQHVDTNLVFRRVPARMFAVLVPLVLVLAAIGIYAVVAYSMSLRTTEIGVRIALGASAGRVVRDAVRETMRVILPGAAVGWLAAFAITADVTGDQPLDVAVLAGVPAVLLAVAAFACWLPARRAARIAPWHALR